MNLGPHQGIRFFDFEDSAVLQERVRAFIAAQLGVSKDALPREWESLTIPGADSLDMVEFLMMIEEEFDDDQV